LFTASRGARIVEARARVVCGEEKIACTALPLVYLSARRVTSRGVWNLREPHILRDVIGEQPEMSDAFPFAIATLAVGASAPVVPDEYHPLLLAGGFIIAYAVRLLESRFHFGLHTQPRRRRTTNKRRRPTNKPPVIKS